MWRSTSALPSQAGSKDFSWWGAYLKNRNQIINVRAHPGPQKPRKSINFSIQNLRPQKSLNFTKSRQGPWKVLKFSFPTGCCRFHFVCFWIATVYWKINYAAWSVLFSSTDWRRTELAPKTFSKEIKLKLTLQTMYNVLCFHPLFWLSQSPTCIEPRTWSSSQNSPQSPIQYPYTSMNVSWLCLVKAARVNASSFTHFIERMVFILIVL